MVADVQIPIIGVDLLANLNLLVDCRKNRNIDGVTSLSTPAQKASTPFPNLKTIGISTLTDDLLAEFPDLTCPSGVPRKVRHNTIHHIKTTPGPPVHCQPRRLVPERLGIAKAEFEAMLRHGTARRSDGPWTSALPLVAKKDNVWRPCGDYSALTLQKIPDRYSVRHIHD